ncbi:hypothetical protein LCGC14_0615140 [marine sediment metagenome]|uniref:Uncharacterized protein n=1 Tax=marine sediment metagenome TaxID=412755 RepID=A0A0F9RB94_9ZZZZ|nr:hypothetical protein [bacterium]
MKQEITFDQWDSLNEKVKLKLDAWLMKKYYVLGWSPSQSAVQQNEWVPKRLMTIGLMIEFLGYEIFHFWLVNNQWVTKVEDGADVHVELADALWEATKEVLNG